MDMASVATRSTRSAPENPPPAPAPSTLAAQTQVCSWLEPAIAEAAGGVRFLPFSGRSRRRCQRRLNLPPRIGVVVSRGAELPARAGSGFPQPRRGSRDDLGGETIGSRRNRQGRDCARAGPCRRRRRRNRPDHRRRGRRHCCSQSRSGKPDCARHPADPDLQSHLRAVGFEHGRTAGRAWRQTRRLGCHRCDARPGDQERHRRIHRRAAAPGGRAVTLTIPAISVNLEQRAPDRAGALVRPRARPHVEMVTCGDPSRPARDPRPAGRAAFNADAYQAFQSEATIPPGTPFNGASSCGYKCGYRAANRTCRA
jgi:hypothetical protein